MSCPQKWAWDKIGGVPEPDTSKKSWGSALHKWAEDYLNGADMDAMPDGTMRWLLVQLDHVHWQGLVGDLRPGTAVVGPLEYAFTK